MLKKIIYLFVFLFAIIACKKNETVPPIVEIYSPVANDSFVVADSFDIYFNIKDEHLQRYKIIISNKLTRKIYISEEGFTNTSDFTYDEKRYIKVQADTNVYMNILGIDANGNTGGSSVEFKLKK